MSKKILVVTGGGADGAVTVGRLESLGVPDYSIGVGVSTGSLVIPHALLGDIEKLKNFYLDVKQKDITEDSAFKRNGKLNITKTIKRTLRSFVGGRLSIGSSKNLRKTIGRAFTRKEYETLRSKNKTAYVGVYSLNVDDSTYFNSRTSNYIDFLDWMWGSSNPPVVFSLLEKIGLNDCIEQWCDGGVKEVMPISFALSLSSKGDEVDVFMHRPRRKKKFRLGVSNIVQFAGRVLISIFRHSEDKDLKLGIELAKSKGVKLNIYWMGYEVNQNSLVFNESEMIERYNLGRKWITEKYKDSYDYRKD